jgi:hypothetical protein
LTLRIRTSILIPMKSLCAVMVLITAGAAFGHHSFAAEYDSNQPVKFKGTVIKVDWMNPHVYFYVDVPSAEGAKDASVVHWACEAGNPNALARRGWKKNSLKAGDEVTVQGYRAKDGSFTMNARSITLSDGNRVFAASSDDGPIN